MAAITAANVVALTDKLTAHYLRALGTGANGLGTVGDTTRAYDAADDLVALVLALADADQVLSLLSDTKDLRTETDALVVIPKLDKRLLTAFDTECKRSGVVLAQTSILDLNSFASYYNLSAPWSCLFAPDFLPIYAAAKGANPTAYNTYLEVLQGATYANGLRKWVVSGAGTGTPTAGYEIVSTVYAGGFGQVIASGITGSGVVTVTGTWRKTDGTVITGDGTVTVTGNNTFVLVPPFTNALLLTVTSLTAANGITAGTLYAEAKRPAGRTNPPV